MTRLYLISLFVFCAMTDHGAAAEVPIVTDGRSDYVICVPADATPAQRHGAEEIQSHIQKMSGAQLPIAEIGATVPAKAIVVAAPRADGDADLGDEGFILRTEDQKVLIIGPGRRGAMYGCYALLEAMGVRWYTPEVTRLPNTHDIVLPDLNQTSMPSFEYREPFMTEAFDRDWSARNRCNGSHAKLDDSTGGKLLYHPFVHSFDELIPPALFAAHPEYFPLINGQRTDGYVQRCLSNPEVLKLAIEGVRRWMKDVPNAQIYSVSQNDNEKLCQCDACTAVAQKYGGQQSGLYLWFVNQVADAVATDHPDKLIDTLAYQFTEAPPTGITPAKNVRIRLCPIACCVSHPFEECNAPPNVAFMGRLKAWSKLTDSLYIWHYNANFAHYLMPFPDFREFPAEIRLYKQNGVKGVFFEGAYAPGGGGAESELRAWVMAKLLWDSQLDADKLVTEWMRGVYGPAEKPMRQWFDLIHQAVSKPTAHLFIFHGADAPQLTAEVMNNGEKLFADAELAAKADPVAMKYVAKEKLCFRYAKLLLKHTTGAELDDFVKDVRAAGITEMREGMPVDQWLANYRAAQ